MNKLRNRVCSRRNCGFEGSDCDLYVPGRTRPPDVSLAPLAILVLVLALAPRAQAFTTFERPGADRSPDADGGLLAVNTPDNQLEGLRDGERPHARGGAGRPRADRGRRARQRRGVGGEPPLRTASAS